MCVCVEGNVYIGCHISISFFLFSRAVKLSEDDVREALAGYVLAMDGCCIDKGPLRNMTITEIKPVMAVHVSINQS